MKHQQVRAVLYYRLLNSLHRKYLAVDEDDTTRKELENDLGFVLFKFLYRRLEVALKRGLE